VIPLRDVIPSRTTPAATVSLIVLNTVAFLHELTLSKFELATFMQTFGLVPAHFSWLAAATSMFLHGGWIHFFGNMLYLWIFGDNVEDRMGHGRFFTFYLICGLAAALAQTATHPDSGVPIIGASGAVAGVMGAYFVMFPHSRILTLVPFFFVMELIEVPAIFFLGIWFLLQLISSVGSLAVVSAEDIGGIAFWAHVVGFGAGAALVFIFRRRERQRVEWWES
jgi:membrane associated rhomboid family serine protease